MVHVIQEVVKHVHYSPGPFVDAAPERVVAFPIHFFYLAAPVFHLMYSPGRHSLNYSPLHH